MTSMAAFSSTQVRSGSPCGCGGSVSPKASCGCGGNCRCGGGCGGTCPTCLDDGYSRPKFFAGQLLTEDDLQQLSDYVVAKNRLHARHLFGSGVACGLEVTCHPCGGGKVMVAPGYALDCCGNDIVISCPQELDIIQMIRDLRRKQHGGVDCGDPCAASTTAQVSQNPATTNDSNPTVATTAVLARDCYKYCLYVNYCEQLSDPVSPYVTDDPCGSQTCETTRVREGFRFELRCPDPTEPEPAICTRLNDCLGDAPSRDRCRTMADYLQKRGREIGTALHSMRTSGHKVLQEDFERDLKRHTEELEKFERSGALAPDALASLSDAQALVEATLALSSDLALLAIQTAEVSRKWVEKLEHALRSSSALLKLAAQKLAEPSFQNTFPTALERAYAASLSGTTQSLLEKAEAAVHSHKPVHDDLILLLAYKVAFGLPMQNQMALDTESLRAQLMFRLEQEAMKTRCDLLDTVSGAPTLHAATTNDISCAVAGEAGRACVILGRAFFELERACFCNALNPPCPSCDDPGVLLACITVADCKVKDICNLDRQFVLSPVALRYWIPEITQIGRAIEKACCPSPCRDEQYPPVTGQRMEGQGRTASAYVSNLEYASLIFRFLQYSCAEKGTARYALEGLDELATSRTAVPSAAQTGPAIELAALRDELEKLRAEHEHLTARLSRLERKRPDTREAP